MQVSSSTWQRGGTHRHGLEGTNERMKRGVALSGLLQALLESSGRGHTWQLGIAWATPPLPRPQRTRRLRGQQLQTPLPLAWERASLSGFRRPGKARLVNQTGRPE